MSEPLRRAGRGELADGATLIWSVAEGGRGRRWRSTTLDAEGRVVVALLVDVDPEGRIGRVELTSPAGMLTFHPEADGTCAHGNVVTPAGVRPITVAWSERHELRVADSPILAAIAAHHRPPGRMTADVVAVDAHLDVTELEGVPAWEGSVPIDDRGVPRLPRASEWALESS